MNATPPLKNEAMQFLYEAGYERSISSKPTQNDFKELGLEYIYFDKQRCRTTSLCRELAERHLIPILGEPTVLEDNSFVWKL